MSTNWKVLGHFYNNDDVAKALNQAGVGVGACVGLNIAKTQFSVWGNDLSIVLPTYIWKFLIESDSETDLTDAANKFRAESAAATVNANGAWVLWGYIPG